ncbi:MAG: sodium:proton antiporter [Firmicutes bacterium]|nr:sodium:proton antiporter [Bacillota bacterium]
MAELNKQLQSEMEKFEARKSIAILAAVVAAAVIMKLTVVPDDIANLGWMSVIPAVFLVVYIFATKRIMEALIMASLIGFIFANQPGENIIYQFVDAVQRVMSESDIPWLITVCGLMGSIIALIDRSGGAFAFGQWAAKRAHSKKTALMWTWVLGLIIFIDDYLNSATVGACMARLTDKFKTSREMLAYVCSSTAAPVCVLVPITTWAVFAGKVMVSAGWQEGDATPVEMFMKTIPYNFYGWVAAIMVPLVIFGLIPKWGPMKAAEERVENGGPVAPPGSEKISIITSDTEEVKMPDNPNILNFIIPLVVMIGTTVIFDTRMEVGVMCALAVMLPLYLLQGVMTGNEFWDLVLKGIGNMLLPLMLMVLAFLFADITGTIGFTKFCITVAAAHAPIALLPFIVFMVLSCTEFVTGTNWGMYIIALPIVIPLGLETGCNMPLIVSAVISAGVFGSHCCFYSDCTLITSASCGCDNFRHAITQASFAILAAVVCAVIYLVLGFVMAP